MTFVGDRSRGSVQIGPAGGLADGRLDCVPYERTSLPRSGDPVDLSNQVVLNLNVHSHVPNLAHSQVSILKAS